MASHRINGIVLGLDRVDFTTLEEVQESWNPLRTSQVDLRRVDEDGTDPLAEGLRAHAADLKGPCAVALPAGSCLLRVAELPATDPDELLGMVELQIDKFSPFPVDQLELSYEVLDQGENRSRVLIAAAQNKRVSELRDTFHAMGSFVHSIDVDAVCRWKQIEASPQAPKAGREVVLVMEPAEATLLVCDQGVPSLLRALGGEADMGREAYCAMLAEETEYALTSMETEWGGSDEDTHFSIWHQGAAPQDVATAIGEQSGSTVTLHRMDALPPLSETVARRAVDDDAGRLNLAPPEWEEQERASQTRRKLMMATGGLLLVWLLVVAVFLGLLAGQRRKLSVVREQLKALEVPAAEVKEIRDKAQFLERYIDQTYSSLEVLRELSVLMPQGVELNGMTFSRGGTINIRGSADTRSPVYTFQSGLEKSSLFTEVKLGKVDVLKGKNVFRLSAEAKGGGQ